MLKDLLEPYKIYNYVSSISKNLYIHKFHDKSDECDSNKNKKSLLM